MSTIPRSSRADVRNPMLAIPEVQAEFESLSPEASASLERVLRALSKTWRAKADHSWKTRKPPLASYWAQNAVNARHLALAISRTRAGKAAAS